MRGIEPRIQLGKLIQGVIDPFSGDRREVYAGMANLADETSPSRRVAPAALPQDCPFGMTERVEYSATTGNEDTECFFVGCVMHGSIQQFCSKKKQSTYDRPRG